MDAEKVNPDPVDQDQSAEKKVSMRIWVRVIVVYMIALAIIFDYYLANVIGMALSPSFSFGFLFIVCGTPMLIPLVPSVIGLLNLSRTGFLAAVTFFFFSE